MRRAIIVGGGIGGLTAGLALSQRGWDVSVHEAAPELRPVGAGIWVPINALRVLDRLGVAAAVTAAGVELDRIQLLTSGGDEIYSTDLRPLRHRLGHTVVSIRRAKLVEQLAAALPPRSLRLGSALVDYNVSSDRVLAVFADGGEAAGDLLVAADGIHSLVRQKLDSAAGLRTSGQVCYRGISRLKLPDECRRSAREYWGGASRFGWSVVGPEEVYWYAPVSLANQGRDSSRDLVEKLRARYTDFPDPIPELLRRTAASDVIHTELNEIWRSRRWWSERVVLLGDAAHAMTPNLGQGGAQAIEDAYVLADVLAEHSELNAGLATYQRRRQARVAWIAATARRIGQLAHWEQPLLCRIRNGILRNMPSSWHSRPLWRLLAQGPV
ncbi:MAG: FAD-dependent monooxygenase [Pirellulales bacterium]